jgi:voltage-gated potassium channel
MLPLVATFGLAAICLESGAESGSLQDSLLQMAVWAAWGFFSAELALRLWIAPEGHDHRLVTRRWIYQSYLISARGVIDIAAVVSLPLGWALGLEPRDMALLGVVWAFKYVRHSTGLALVIRVGLRARTQLFSVLAVFFVLFLIAATLAYIFERRAQPEQFGSIPHAMWWAITTLTTTGYGDTIPQTPLGRLLAGWSMIGGISVFALLAGIIANAFTEEIKRADFLRTWDLVTKIPFFSDLGAAATSDVVQLLQPRYVRRGTVLFRRGDRGDVMYFIVSGEVTVELQPTPQVLRDGSFVGEMALLFRSRRSASVVATQNSHLLVLDVANLRTLAGRRPEIVEAIETEAKRRKAHNQAQPA